MPLEVFHILVASYTDEVYTLRFDPATCSLACSSTVHVGWHPSWITAHPDNRSLIFAALEQPEGKIVALKYGSDGNGEVVAESSSGGASPCSLLATTEELFVANYMTGTIGTHPISPAPPYIASTSPVRLVQLSGSGPNAVRQSGSRPHQVVMHHHHHHHHHHDGGGGLPEGAELLVPDLGSDKTWRFARDDRGLWNPVGYVQYAPGGGPRHVALHEGMLYTVLELTSSVASHRLPPLPAEPTEVDTSSTYLHLAKGEGGEGGEGEGSSGGGGGGVNDDERLAAEIVVPKPNRSFPTAYLYVSNRNGSSPEDDTIAIFCIEDGGVLELVGEYPTGLKHVRGIAFGGQDDRWLVAGGMTEGGVKVFERIEGGRTFRMAAQNEGIKAPSGFLWL